MSVGSVRPFIWSVIDIVSPSQPVHMLRKRFSIHLLQIIVKLNRSVCHLPEELTSQVCFWWMLSISSQPKVVMFYQCDGGLECVPYLSTVPAVLVDIDLLIVFYLCKLHDFLAFNRNI